MRGYKSSSLVQDDLANLTSLIRLVIMCEVFDQLSFTEIEIENNNKYFNIKYFIRLQETYLNESHDYTS